jgi:phosphoribosylanthranilate isomerase
MSLDMTPLQVPRTRIKICGLTREADVDAAVAAGADAIGFVMYDKSPRLLHPIGLPSWPVACPLL